jgi:hypothetical protein
MITGQQTVDDIYGVLDEQKNVVTPKTRQEWYDFCENRDLRRVDFWERNGVQVSTVFLPVDHGFGGTSLWFETMVFGGAMNDEQRRYATWAEAVAGHNEVVAEVEATMRTRMITFD